MEYVRYIGLHTDMALCIAVNYRKGYFDVEDITQGVFWKQKMLIQNHLFYVLHKVLKYCMNPL